MTEIGVGTTEHFVSSMMCKEGDIECIKRAAKYTDILVCVCVSLIVVLIVYWRLKIGNNIK